MTCFQTLAAFQKSRAELYVHAMLEQIRCPAYFEQPDPGALATKAVHYIRCIWCATCEEEWHAWEADTAAFHAWLKAA